MLSRGGIFLSPLLGRGESPFSNWLKGASPAFLYQLLRGGTCRVNSSAQLTGRDRSCSGLAAGAACLGLVAGERHVRKRRCEATMAGGMKVAESTAVGSGLWDWGAGGSVIMRLLLVLFGCLFCGSGTTRAPSAKGAVAEGVFFENWSLFGGCGLFLCGGRRVCGGPRGAKGEAASTSGCRDCGVSVLGCSGELPEWREAVSLLANFGREAWAG